MRLTSRSNETGALDSLRSGPYLLSHPRRLHPKMSVKPLYDSSAKVTLVWTAPRCRVVPFPRVFCILRFPPKSSQPHKYFVAEERRNVHVPVAMDQQERSQNVIEIMDRGILDVFLSDLPRCST